MKALVLYLTILKRKHISLPLNVETDRFVICLVLPECLSVKICCISPASDSEANSDGADADSLFQLFFSFSLAQEKRSENCRRSGTEGQSLCLYPLLSRNIIFCPTPTMAARAKKVKRFAHAITVISVHYRDFEHAYVYWIWLRGSARYVITIVIKSIKQSRSGNLLHSDWRKHSKGGGEWGANHECTAPEVNPVTLSYTFYHRWQPFHIPSCSEGTPPHFLIFYFNNPIESFNGSSFGDSLHGILKGPFKNCNDSFPSLLCTSIRNTPTLPNLIKYTRSRTQKFRHWLCWLGSHKVLHKQCFYTFCHNKDFSLLQLLTETLAKT